MLPALWLYTALFTIGLWVLEASMFSGCAAKLRVDPHFSFKGATCLVDINQLAVLGHPTVAAGALGLAAVLVVAVASQWRPAIVAPGETVEPELTRL
jgi:type IV secretory pathway TrbD component